MRVSIITVCYNSAKFIRTAIESTLSQTYPEIEYIVIDGSSTDGTRALVESYGNKISKFVSEPDPGIYAAMNKGIKLARGEVVGILNSDDFFCNNHVIERIAAAFSDDGIQAVYGDVQYVNPDNPRKKVRFYSSRKFSPEMFKYGFMPAHPSFYVRRELFEKYGYYKEDYKIAADFELLVRFMHHHKINARYIQMPFVTMRTGGVSTRSLKGKLILNKEIVRACFENGIRTGNLMVYSKYFIKIFELFGKSF